MGPCSLWRDRKGHIHPDSMCLRLDKAASEQGVGQAGQVVTRRIPGDPCLPPSAAEVRGGDEHEGATLWVQRGGGPQGQVG